ncbi:protein-lysine methyltransferase METTL21C [Polypterus senegalus]|uniref:protein-lysine methyltransferase METTL21C n=1 Tax=Polypterus senegalus TaxID=55291 RepID=UPI001965A25E|nr:protein-lysine methyltransferase METTL21C [Polypterus senegalus]
MDPKQSLNQQSDVKEANENDTEGHAEMSSDSNSSSADKELPVESELVPSATLPKLPWEPSSYSVFGKDIYSFLGYEIKIQESIDSYAAIVWPGAIALGQYLENNQQEFNLRDKAILELGAGTGLLSIMACLLGGWVTATDLPDVLGNLKCNLISNTRNRCRYVPQVAALDWGENLAETYPQSVYRYDYVLAADVVYVHKYLDELLNAMKHFVQPGTTLLWSNKYRFRSDLTFTEKFKDAFKTTLLAEFPDTDVKIFMATTKDD